MILAVCASRAAPAGGRVARLAKGYEVLVREELSDGRAEYGEPLGD
ncbi:MAG TPA: hypothetical protein VEX68_05940 [Bryobacteraceae bacterium]|nr:hypothetical protein [Bryobacteraceae bacterium]